MKEYVIALAVVLTLFESECLLAASSAFTYQGQLKQNGTPATGTFDLQFKLFDSDQNGSQQGTTIDKQSTPISNGLFTVILDFGFSAFTGPDRFLEVSVKPAGIGTFSPLPRQKLTATPYSLTALSISNGSVTTPKIADGAVTADKIASLPKVRATNSAFQTLNDANRIVFDVETFDIGDFHSATDNRKFIIPRTGVYLISAGVEFNSAPNTAANFLVYVNGSRSSSFPADRTAISPTGTRSLTTTGVLSLSQGDVVEASLGLADGTSIGVQANSTFFAIVLLP